MEIPNAFILPIDEGLCRALYYDFPLEYEWADFGFLDPDNKLGSKLQPKQKVSLTVGVLDTKGDVFAPQELTTRFKTRTFTGIILVINHMPAIFNTDKDVTRITLLYPQEPYK